MSAKMGTRPGTRPEDKIPEHDYHIGVGPGWEAIRKDGREVMRFEGELQRQIIAVQKTLDAWNIAYLLLHGGHVEKGTMARSGLRTDIEPAAVIAHCQGLMPKEIKALK